MFSGESTRRDQNNAPDVVGRAASRPAYHHSSKRITARHGSISHPSLRRSQPLLELLQRQHEIAMVVRPVVLIILVSTGAGSAPGATRAAEGPTVHEHGSPRNLDIARSASSPFVIHHAAPRPASRENSRVIMRQRTAHERGKGRVNG